MKVYWLVALSVMISLILIGCNSNKKHNTYDVKDPSRITVFTHAGAVEFDKPKGIDLRNQGAQAWITTKDDKEILVINGAIIVEP